MVGSRTRRAKSPDGQGHFNSVETPSHAAAACHRAVLNFNAGSCPMQLEVHWQSSMARSEPLKLAGSGLFGLHREGAAGLGASDAPPAASGPGGAPTRSPSAPGGAARAPTIGPRPGFMPLLGPVCHYGTVALLKCHTGSGPMAVIPEASPRPGYARACQWPWATADTQRASPSPDGPPGP
jgi:hypothetical protein